MQNIKKQILQDKELKALLKAGESEYVEWTESPNNRDKIAKAICAFSNDLACAGKTGVIFIGIKDNGECAHLSVTDEMLVNIASFSRQGNLQPFPVINVQKWVNEACETIVVTVQPSKNPPMRYRGCCYVRIGPSVRMATKDEEDRLIEKRQANALPEDMQGIASATVEEDLNIGYFKTYYLPTAISREVLEENKRDTQTQMRSLGLLDHQNQPTMTALLLMGTNPRNWFPGAYIQFVRFEGKALTDPVRDQKEVSGTLPDQIRRIEEILQSHISFALRLSDTKHIESPDYPWTALSQLVRNALMHRDYKSYNPVRVHWFSDRVEIQSPGGPYGALNKDNFGTEGVTAYRNPNIATALKNLGFVERFGFGLPQTRKALKDNGNPALQLKALDSSILAVVTKKTAS